MSWGQQQGPQGHPQQGYGQYPQQPQQQYRQPPPPKKGIGAGVIIAILAAVLALVVVVGGVVAFLVLRSGPSESSSSSSSSADADHSAALKTKAEALRDAVKTGKPKEVEGPLLELGMTPETAKTWFAATFEPKAADDLGGYWERQVFPNITDMVKDIRKANEGDQTIVRVTRLASTADVESCELILCKYTEKDNLKKLFAAMKKPQALYVVTFAKPGSNLTSDQTDVYYFAEIQGSFSYLGSLQMF